MCPRLRKRIWFRLRLPRIWPAAGISWARFRREDTPIAPDGKQSSVLIERLYETYQNHVDASAAGPTVRDVDGDGENEVVSITLEADGTPYCAILDGGGG